MRARQVQLDRLDAVRGHLRGDARKFVGVFAEHRADDNCPAFLGALHLVRVFDDPGIRQAYGVQEAGVELDDRRVRIALSRLRSDTLCDDRTGARLEHAGHGTARLVEESGSEHRRVAKPHPGDLGPEVHHRADRIDGCPKGFGSRESAGPSCRPFGGPRRRPRQLSIYIVQLPCAHGEWKTEMTVEQNLRMVDAAFEAINERNWDHLWGLHVDNIVMSSPDLPEPVRGREAVQERLQSWGEALPDLSWTRLRGFGQSNSGSCARPGRTDLTGHSVRSDPEATPWVSRNVNSLAPPPRTFMRTASHQMGDARRGPGSRSPDRGDPEKTGDRGTVSAAGGRDRSRSAR